MTGREKELTTIISHKEDKINNLKRKIRMYGDMHGGLKTDIIRTEHQIKYYKEKLEDYLKSLPPEPPPDARNYCGKIPYTSEDDAHKARSLINRDLIKASKTPIKHVYFCDICEAWHLATKKPYNITITK